MQITPTGNNWTNPAAISQQTLNDAKHAGATSHRTTNPDAVDKLEQTEKTGDRDANERYDGPMPSANAQVTKDDVNMSENALLSLPAIDDLPESTLDIMG